MRSGPTAMAACSFGSIRAIFGSIGIPLSVALLGSLRTVAGTRPLLLGASRKSFIAKITGADTGDRLPGSLAALAKAFQAGATMVRVHDVAESVQFLDVMKAVADGGAGQNYPRSPLTG